MNTKYISFLELKTQKVSLVLRTRENSDVFNSLDEIYLAFTSKSKYPLYTPLSYSETRVCRGITVFLNLLQKIDGRVFVIVREVCLIE